jgi:RimJ/RimL family protein N-acetyltransferase
VLVSPCARSSGGPDQRRSARARFARHSLLDNRLVAVPAFPLLTNRLQLRPFEDADLDAMHAIYGREDVNRYLDWGPRSRADIAEWLGRIKTFTALSPGGEALRLAALLRGTDMLIGDFSVWRTSQEHQQGEIGFVLHPDFHGKGYGLEAARLMLQVGFERLGFHRIAGQCDPRNESSVALMERLGMRHEAHLRENLLVKDEWVDSLVFAMLASEWQARPSPILEPG